MNIIGARIKKMCTIRDKNQSELAALISMEPSNLSSMITSKSANPTSSMIIAIADILNCTTDYLLCRSDDYERRTSSDVINEYLEDLEGATEEQEELLEIIEILAQYKISKYRKGRRTGIANLRKLKNELNLD